MDHKRLHALITLLDDPDDSVFKMVEQEILKEDASIVDKLEQIWETNLDELIQSRIENIIQQIQFNETKAKINNWVNQQQLDLFEGHFLISSYQYPDIKQKQIEQKIDRIAKDIWLEFKNSLTALEKITIINHMLYDIHKFSINHSNLASPQNCYLNQILETHKGNPISLAVLYILIARKLELPIWFIDFPRNPLLAYIDPEIAREAHGQNTENPILFYINPSNKGAIVGKREIDYLIKKNELLSKEMVTTPCSDKLILHRIVDSLIAAYDELGSNDKSNDLKDIASML